MWSANGKTKLLTYLEAIEETDQDIIDEFLDNCANNQQILLYALQLAEDKLRIRHCDTAGFVQSRECKHLVGDVCGVLRWQVVVDNWRRCEEFDIKLN